MLAKRRKDYNGVITVHNPIPPCLLPHMSPTSAEQKTSSVLECPNVRRSVSQKSSRVVTCLHHTSPRSVEQKPSSVVECPNVRRSVSQKSTRVVTRPGTVADTLSSCSIKQLQDQFLLERQEAYAILQSLLEIENGFIKDVEHFLNHTDTLKARKCELIHRRWIEHVWQPVQRSIKLRFTRRCYEAAEPMKVSTTSLKDPKFLYSHSCMKETSQSQTDGCQSVSSAEKRSRNKRDLHKGSRSLGPVYMATADGRCYRPECWSGISLSQRYSEKS